MGPERPQRLRVRRREPQITAGALPHDARHRRRMPSATPQHRCARSVCPRRSGLVTHSSNGQHHGRVLRVFLNLGPQTLDVHVHQAGVRWVTIAPHLFEQHITSKHLPRFARQRDQQVELQRRQGDLLAVPGHLVRRHVDLDVGDGEHLRGLVVVAPQPRPHPGHQFLGLERLHDVVIGARLEAQHHIHGVGLGGQHHDRNTGIGAQHPAHVDAVHAGQHQVQQHQIGAQFAHRGQGLGTVTDDRGVETLPTQHDGEHLGQRSVVIDD